MGARTCIAPAQAHRHTPHARARTKPRLTFAPGARLVRCLVFLRVVADEMRRWAQALRRAETLPRPATIDGRVPRGDLESRRISTEKTSKAGILT